MPSRPHVCSIALVSTACLLTSLPAAAQAPAAEQRDPVGSAPAATPPADASAAAAPAAEPSVTEPSAADPAEEAAAVEPVAPASDKGKRKDKNKKRGDARDARDDRSGREAESTTFAFGNIGGTLQIKGRVFARAELMHRRETVVSQTGGLEDRDLNALDLSLGSARFGFDYESPLRWLSLTLELDIAGKPEVKDAFVQAGKRFFLKAGQFKIPAPALELESPWTLPLVRRGLINDLLTEWLDVAGRRPGFAVGYRGKGGIKPRLTLGAFQGTTLDQVAPGDRDVELIEEAKLNAQTLAARAEVKLYGLELGAWYEHRTGGPVIGDFEHYETAGLDATLDHAFQRGGLRIWLDGTLGESFYVADDKPGDDETPLFFSARALAAYRFGGVALGDPYLEPFGYFAMLDPDLEVVSDFVTETAVGINVGYWNRGRITLQGEMTRGQRNMPSGFLDHQDPDRLSLLLQVGARF